MRSRSSSAGTYLLAVGDFSITILSIIDLSKKKAAQMGERLPMFAPSR